MPNFIIKPGEFYYHFKRNPDLGLENHAYLIVGIAQDTEDRTKYSVCYKPLYFCDPKKEDEKGVSFHSRPYEMFIEMVDKQEYSGPRFIKITDPETIKYLKNTPLYGSLWMGESA
jgi:hypothetical protein